MIKMRLLKGNKAQAMTEYILVIALLSVVFAVSIGVMNKILTAFAVRIVDIFWYPIP